MKFCKDCKHYEPQWGTRPRCGLSGGIDPVSGGRKRPEFGCDVVRQDYINECGPNARFFVPIKPEPVKPKEVLDNQPKIRQNWFLRLINFLKGYKNAKEPIQT